MASEARAPRLKALFEQGKTLRYKRGETIGSTDEDSLILMVSEGYIKRYMIRNDGGLGLQILYGPQDVFSLTRIFRLLCNQSLYDGPETYYYAAQCDSIVFSVSGDDLLKAVRQDPFLYKELFAEAGQHLKACVHSIENISLHNVTARVAHQLVYLLQEFGQREGAGSELHITLTHQDIADMLGVTRASVTLAIGQLRAKGLLLPKRSFVTPNLDALAQQAYS